MTIIRNLCIIALALFVLACGTFGDDFNDVKPEKTDESADINDADAGSDSGAN
jgi:hypothetical protein